MGRSIEATGRLKLAELSADEREVLALLCRGYTERRIARELGISVSSVRRRLKSASQVLGGANRLHTAVIATALGLVGDVLHEGTRQGE